MANDLMSDLVLRSIDQYERAVRWSWGILAALALAYTMTFLGYVRVTGDLEASKNERARLSAFQEEVNDETGRLEREVKSAANLLRQDISEAFDQLRLNLRRLNADVTAAYCIRPGISGRDLQICMAPLRRQQSIAAAERRAGVSTQLLAGADIYPDLDKPSLSTILPDDIQEAISNSENVEAALQIVEPFVDKEYVAPLFASLNEFWSSKVEPTLHVLADDIIELNNRWEEVQPESLEQARLNATNLRAVRASISSLIFEPPDKNLWWLTVRGKEETRTALILDVEGQVFKPLDVHRSFDEMINRLEQAVSTERRLQAALNDHLKDLEAQFDAYRAQLTKTLQPLEFLPVDLELFCRHFPLVVGMVGALVLLWPAYRFRIACMTVSWAGTTVGAQTGKWLMARQQASFFSFVQVRMSQSTGRTPLARQVSRAIQLPLLVLVLLILVVGSAFQLSRLASVPLFQLAVGSVLSVLVVVTAAGLNRRFSDIGASGAGQLTSNGSQDMHGKL